MRATPPARTARAPAAAASQSARPAGSGVGHASSAAVASAPAAAPAARPEPFGFATVERLARQRASQSYRNRSPRLPERLAHLSYDQYRDIRFKPVYALWHGQSLFEVQFFHRGFNFDRRVEISQVIDGVAYPVRYTPAWFQFDRLGRLATRLPADLGFAGFRVHYPLNTPTYKDELIVFLGASYFRVLGRNQVYGLSARGLAINTATTAGEEFPWFTDFWLVKPTSPEQRTLTLYALLDSESVAGAYQFEVRPGNITQVEVTAELFPRKSIEKLGLAPLTSMFLYGADPAGHRFDDYRPQVHDSDGLKLQTGNGEWLWRPLANPRQLFVNRFMDTHPHGFGLAQRDRNFADYQDPDARFQLRPSYWIQPLGDWGHGGVELVEIPTDEEIHDNIVAYWVPATPTEPGKPLRVGYLLSAFLSSTQWPPGGRVVATRTQGAAVSGSKDARRFYVDFAGGDLDGLDPRQPLRANIAVSGGRVDTVSVERLPDGVWRASFRALPARPRQAMDLHCYLTLYGEALTETWTYQTSS
ncbi:MAG TPA: glucan biosynthesis protein G [Steroidobacteraceae bacterium]|nr:glucan biosynthesis protein G [Steroidobacteraceae bacterium]